MVNAEKFWDRLSKNWDKSESIEDVLQYKSVGYIKEYLKKEDIVLDFGCATGTMAFALSPLVKEIHGIDLSGKMIQLANERISNQSTDKVFFKKENIMDTQFKAGQFDRIISFNVLHLVDHLDGTLSKIHDLLKPSGHFLFMTPCLQEKPFLSGIIKILKALKIIPLGGCFKIKELERAVRDKGFQILKSESIDGNPFEHFIIAVKE
ncbi:MAG: class I SAM-dependent methyltransferase [Spirochaetes bacterium]|nr:class I SAM-dependent methyltransferase [Spirochaetota bacterium]